MQFLFAVALIAIFTVMVQTMNAPNRRRRYHYPDAGNELDALDDYDFDHREHYPPTALYNPYQQPYPSTHYPPQQYPSPPAYYPQQPFLHYPLSYVPQQKPSLPPPRRGNFLGTLVTISLALILAIVLLHRTPKSGVTQEPAKGQEAPGSFHGSNSLPLLKQDVYVLWLRDCRTGKEAESVRAILITDLGDEKLSTLKLGATAALCVLVKSKRAAEQELDMWKQFRAKEIELYDLEPRIVNLHDLCGRLAVSLDHSAIICGDE